MDDLFLITDWQMNINLNYDFLFAVKVDINERNIHYTRYSFHGVLISCDRFRNIILN